MSSDPPDNAPVGDLPRSARAIADHARAAGIHIEIRHFPEGTRTAADAAAAIGVEVAQIVKSLVFAAGDPSDRASGRIVLALVSGNNQLDERRLAAAAGATGTWRVDAESVRAATGLAVGGVSPFGHGARLDTFIDETLLVHDVVWAAAGTPHHNFSIAPADLVVASGGRVCALRRPPKP